MANIKLLHPQEIEVLYLLPAIRREFAIELKKGGMEQKKIAEYLGVTEAAISQYLKSKRAAKISFEKKIVDEIKHSAKKIKNRSTVLVETQKLLKFLHKQGVTCKVHKELAEIPRNCSVCE